MQTDSFALLEKGSVNKFPFSINKRWGRNVFTSKEDLPDASLWTLLLVKYELLNV